MQTSHSTSILPITAAAALTLLLAAAMASGALAQYDSQGRYVPSPMGQPGDPYRSTVPGYPGTPGGSKRLAPPSRGQQIETPNIAPFDARLERPSSTAPLSVIYPTRAQCEAGWSRDSGIPKTRFARACKAMAP